MGGKRRLRERALSDRLLGYSYRHLGELKKSYANYQRALSIDPDHCGGREYLGELYLQKDELEKVKEHLKILNVPE